MFATILFVNLSATPCLVPDRSPTGESTPSNLESVWRDQLQRDGSMTIKLNNGRVYVRPGGMKDGKLTNCDIILRFDDHGNSRAVYTAREAEIRFDPKQHRLVLHVRGVEFTTVTEAGYVSGYVEGHLLMLELPPSSRK